MLKKPESLANKGVPNNKKHFESAKMRRIVTNYNKL
jgi:hypothetical protein